MSTGIPGACGACGGLRRLPAQDGAHYLLSTERREACMNRMNNLLKAHS
jgi:hypothetical protein